MIRVNLLPAHRKRALRSRKRLRVWLAVLLVYSVAALSACLAARIAWDDRSGADERQLQKSRNELRQTETAIAVAKRDLTSLQTRKRMIMLLTDQPNWADFLSLLGQRLGPDLVLRDLRLHKLAAIAAAGPVKPAANVSGQQVYKLEMRGLAKAQTNVRHYVTALEETKLFDEVRLLRTGREAFLNETVTSFDLECRFHDQGGY